MTVRQLNTLTPVSLLTLYEAVNEIINSDTEDSENTFIHVLEEDIKNVYEAKTRETIGQGLKTYRVLKPYLN